MHAYKLQNIQCDFPQTFCDFGMKIHVEFIILQLQVTNPWISDEDIGYTTLTPANPFHHSPHLPSRPRRPTSITVWEERENAYVEEPSRTNATVIQVIPSTPTPQSDATDHLLRVPSPV